MLTAIMAAPVLVALCGCPAGMAPLGKPAATFDTATAKVVTNTENAYRTADRLYFDEQMSAAVLAYDKQPNWDPHSIKPLLTPRQLEARTTILEALKAYAASLDQIANAGTSNAKAIDTNSAAVGNNLVTLSGNLASATGADELAVPQREGNIVSVATRELGQFLVAHKARKDLGRIVVQMDPSITSICTVLQTDIATLRRQAANDYSQMLTQQDQFIRNAGTQLSPEERRTEIRRLPELLQKAKNTDDLLDALGKSIGKLATAHKAMATTAQGGNPESLSAALADFADYAESVATFYQSLPQK